MLNIQGMTHVCLQIKKTFSTESRSTRILFSPLFRGHLFIFPSQKIFASLTMFVFFTMTLNPQSNLCSSLSSIKDYIQIHLIRYDSSGLVIRQMYRQLTDNSQQTQEKYIQFPYGIRTHNPIKRMAVEPHFSAIGNWDRHWCLLKITNNGFRKLRTVLYSMLRSYTLNIEVFWNITSPYSDTVKQTNGFYDKVTALNFALFTSDLCLVFPCLRWVRKGNFDVTFINNNICYPTGYF